MKTLLIRLSILLLPTLTCAQTSPAGDNGMAGGTDRSYGTGFIPSPYYQYQNRPDSTHQDKDTSYMEQQWNDGSQPNESNNSSNKSRKKKKNK